VTETFSRNISHQLELASAGRHSSAHEPGEGGQVVGSRNRQVGRIDAWLDLGAAQVRPMAFGTVRRGHVPTAGKLWPKINRYFPSIFGDLLGRGVELARQQPDPAEQANPPRWTCGTAGRLRPDRRDERGNFAILQPAEGPRRNDDQRAAVVADALTDCPGELFVAGLCRNCGEVRRVDLRDMWLIEEQVAAQSFVVAADTAQDDELASRFGELGRRRFCQMLTLPGSVRDELLPGNQPHAGRGNQDQYDKRYQAVRGPTHCVRHVRSPRLGLSL